MKVIESTEPSADFFGVPLYAEYANLGASFSRQVNPTPVANPSWLAINHRLAEDLNLTIENLEQEAALKVFSGCTVIPNSRPVAQAYSGHQFGYFSPQLGDGRAILLGEIKGRDNAIYDVQLKGSGPTPFSRSGDGRAAMGPVIREFVVSEAMHALGVPTSRCLTAVATGESVIRQSMLPGAILSRIASSHLRVGTFEYFSPQSAQHNPQALKTLALFAIHRHYPELIEHQTPYTELLKAVARRQALLVSEWLRVGFIHGVMNTDNFTISGETLDYGPCAFLDEYHSEKVFSSIDSHGRYAYGNQPSIAAWNIARLGESLAPLIQLDGGSTEEVIQDVITLFGTHFQQAWRGTLAHKLGLESLDDKIDEQLVESYLSLLEKNSVDFTLAFRYLSSVCDDNQATVANHNHELAWFNAQFHSDQSAFDQWLQQWRARLQQKAIASERAAANMNSVNPLYIPRNHIVEEAITAAEQGQLEPFRRLYQMVQKPYEAQTERDYYATPPTEAEKVKRTFCGT